MLQIKTGPEVCTVQVIIKLDDLVITKVPLFSASNVTSHERTQSWNHMTA